MEHPNIDAPGGMPHARIIEGIALADEIRHEVQEQIQKLKIAPGLAVLLVGHNPASELYVRLKQRAAHEAGIIFSLYRFDEKVKEAELFETIDWLNRDNDIHAILIQLPLPPRFDTDTVIRAIDPKKDADGFHPDNVTAYLSDTGVCAPGLAMGIMQLIQSTGQNIAQKSALIIARDSVFTKTLSHTLKAFGVTASVAGPDDEKMPAAARAADILITAIGKPGAITAAQVKSNSIIIDVGITRQGNKTVGDVDFESCGKKAGWITPVPGGVGPMTVAALLKSVLALAREQTRQA